ncbi:2OG-Fe dioxygenase family protein [Lonsdalea quercina]|uniref:2OG-Fe dioxygenase family protein n=1 Tax=Lonsdalea quercina TaxID=71657 RepID=UPI0039764EB0
MRFSSETNIVESKLKQAVCRDCHNNMCKIIAKKDDTLMPSARVQSLLCSHRVETLAEALPTPEGIHRDGASCVFIMRVNRVNVSNGETGIYDRERKKLARHTLSSPLDEAIVNVDRTQQGFRDVLIITFNKR